MTLESGGSETYAAAGVDIDAGSRLAARIKEIVRSAGRPEVLAGVGPFASLFRLGSYREPVLVASADGVGTKLNVAAAMRRFDTAGVDLVNHCVNDILTTGAEPLFFLDYIASAGLSEDDKIAVVQGIASACRSAGCALIGGETADMPDVYLPHAFDLAGFIVGVVERDGVIDGSKIEEGDALLGLASNGLHTNGYSLARRVFHVGLGGDPEAEKAALYRSYPELGLTLGEALLLPHRCYYREVKPVLTYLKGIAHITGGGLVDNVPRILPEGLAARFDRGTWKTPPIFTLIQREGKVSDDEMYRVFNMGLGMVLVCSQADVEAVRSLLPEARVVGQVVPQAGGKRVVLS
ncbi:MAG TPA: phosphoribosylformylglycinamidine cyclo-ligase [Dehalococcoidia bacterium]|nr:phosphoribosylformylglycinamidine cyclo-ligase [Dehalococcoidia bacterium]